MKGLSTPVQRENVAMKLDLAELMLEILRVSCEEQRAKQQEDLRKGSVLRVSTPPSVSLLLLRVTSGYLTLCLLPRLWKTLSKSHQIILARNRNGLFSQSQ